MGSFGTRVLAGCLSALSGLLYLTAVLAALLVIKTFFIADPLNHAGPFAALALGLALGGLLAQWAARRVASLIG
ncbi:MAG: hypothetical protein KGQ46_07265 [Hyphomicrobiales bacterium]|nr:hypothetical protein [Hyphomicrobiales bacterium]MDE2113994.1 hypothetical protein [Hyphomicrobiales bacterium]